MGLSVTNTRLYLQTGVDNQEEMKKYQELKKETKEKLGSSFTSEHDRICAILAKDSNATVDDVEKMYDMAKGNAPENLCGGGIDKLQSFQKALKSVPGYSKTELDANNLMELLSLYNSSFLVQRSGMTQQETFIENAKRYLSELESNETNTTGGAHNEVSNIQQKFQDSQKVFRATVDDNSKAEIKLSQSKSNLDLQDYMSMQMRIYSKLK